MGSSTKLCCMASGKSNVGGRLVRWDGRKGGRVMRWQRGKGGRVRRWEGGRFLVLFKGEGHRASSKFYFFVSDINP